MITTVDAVGAWLASNGEPVPADVLGAAYQSAEAYVSSRCVWPTEDSSGGPIDAPADLVMAVNLQTARILTRRSSANGILGMSDMGAVRVPGTDPDVARLMDPYQPVAFG